MKRPEKSSLFKKKLAHAIALEHDPMFKRAFRTPPRLFVGKNNHIVAMNHFGLFHIP